MVIKACVLVAFLFAGLRYVFIANDLSSSSLAPDTPVLFLKTLYNNGSYMGVVSATLTSTESFVVGANVSAEVKIGLPNAANTSYLIEVMFPDAISVRDIPPHTWQQDWNYLLHDVQFAETEQIQTLNNVTLVYAHEGLYGVNVTIHQAETHSELHFYFYDLVQIKPMSYLQEKLRSNLSFAMNYAILGLTVIMIAPIMVQLIGLIEKFSRGEVHNGDKKRQQNGQNATPSIVNMDPRERLDRFDDVFKLLLTLVGITLAFGSKFLELNTSFSAPLVVLYIVVLVAWSTAHLSNDTSIETWLKLLGWFFFIVLMPQFLLPFLIIITKPSVLIYHLAFWSFFILGNLSYWACFRYLKQSLTDLRFQKLLKFITIAVAKTT